MNNVYTDVCEAFAKVTHSQKRDYPPFTANFNIVLGLNVSTLRASIVMVSPV